MRDPKPIREVTVPGVLAERQRNCASTSSASPGCNSIQWRRLARLALGLLLAASLASPRGFATTRFWVAGPVDSGNWSVARNWSPAGVPQDGDDLVFTATEEQSSLRHDMNNDLVGLRIRRFEFCGYSWMVAGNELTLLEHVDRYGGCGASSVVFNCPIKLGNSTRANIGWGSIIFRGNIDLNGNNLTLISGDQIIVSGQISGAGNVFAVIDAFIEDRESVLRFDGPLGNTFSGQMVVSRLYRDRGYVVFDKESGAVVNDVLVVGDRSGINSRPAVCKLARSHQIGDNATVSISGGSQFLLEGNTETIGSLCMTNSATDVQPTLVDTGGSTLSVLGDIIAVNNAAAVVPTIRGKLGLPGPAAAKTSTTQSKP